MLRRLVAMSALAFVALLVTGTAGAQVERAPAPRPVGDSVSTSATSTTAVSSSTTGALPGTTLEADSRDDGTSPAPWLIGSAIVAAAAIAIGGTLLKRRAG